MPREIPEPISFKFQGKKVRSVRIDQDVWFVAKDVFERLDLEWRTFRLNVLPDEWKRKHKIMLAFRGSRQTQTTWLINEQAFYRIVHRSDHPDAVEFANKAAQFLKDMRLGHVTGEDLKDMQETIQGFLFKMTEIPEQRRTNHQFNRGKLPFHRGREWRQAYPLITGKTYDEEIEALRRKGVPEWRLQRSGQDGLRWTAEDYGSAMAFADRTNLLNSGYDKGSVDEAVQAGLPYYEKVGKLVGADRCLSKDYRPRKTAEKNNPKQLSLIE